jgi:hypothetical protein
MPPSYEELQNENAEFQKQKEQETFISTLRKEFSAKWVERAAIFLIGATASALIAYIVEKLLFSK